MNTRALERAIDIAGGQTALAKKISEITGKPVRQGHVWSWLNRTRRVPPEFAIPVEIATEGAVSRHETRPDLYPIAGSAA
jgi:DNA-binding transcriptional regulator YdaS (Cro superfamily)